MRFTFFWALICVPLVVGCDGCRRDPNAGEKDDEKDSTFVSDFTTRSPDPFPSAGMLDDGNPPAGRAIKPGHWITAAVAIRSNNEDVRGELQSQATYSGINFRTGIPDNTGAGITGTGVTGVGDSGGGIPGAGNSAASGDRSANFLTVPNVRPAVLPKGQMRRFDFRLLPPSPSGGTSNNCVLGGRFVSQTRATAVDVGPAPFLTMAAEEYFFVVLTNRPERFTRLRKADWIKPYRDEFDFQIGGANYRIVTPATTDLLTLSETMLDWTNTSVVFWDDGMAEILTPDQATALTDWVHFGGTLVINGADAAESMVQGKLAGLLAIRPAGNAELDLDAAAEMLRTWQVKTDRSTSKQIAVLESGPGRVMLSGEVSESATAIGGTGGLIAEMPVGRGRVVQTRFDLTSDWMTAWESFDSFVNGVILARQPRQYTMQAGDGGVRQFTVGRDAIASAPTMNTRFRLASRDAVLPRLELTRPGELPEVAPENVSQEENGSQKNTASQKKTASRKNASPPNVRPWDDVYTRVDPVTGIAAWTDQSDVVRLCSDILRSESGIEIPNSSLVVRSLGYYLLVLVPLNFIVFRLMGRLEYAWLAVPLIAIGGAVWVARSARLDIGFARSQTELAMLELQPGYPRGHLTRVDAIYNSLSSSYSMNFKTVDGCAVPIRGTAAGDLGGAVFQTSFDEGPTLAGLAVGSNQIRMVHSEQIIDAGGGLRLVAGDRLVNGSQLEITDAFVVEKTIAGELRIAVVGTIGSGSDVGLRFRRRDDVTVDDAMPMQTDQLIRRLMLPGAIPPGTIRLVGRVDRAIDGMTISPEANQVTAQTVVLCHLKHGPLPETSSDVNLLSDVKTIPTSRPADETNADETNSDETNSDENSSDAP